MKQQALGLIETFGMVAAIEAADAALKAAAVELVNNEKVSGGLVTIALTGEVAAVQAAVAAGCAAAARVGRVVGQHVIARPMADVGLLIKGRPTDPDPGPADPPSPADPPDSPDPPEGAGLTAEGSASTRARENGLTDSYLRHLETLAVEELRRLARKTEGLALRGRQISRANRDQLLRELKKAGKLI